ncbi:MAG: ABC transporter permease subunit [Candidatus Bathyarchaeota archaeon]|nr:ABC transporter permease subunit [Candidatus Bathyarchaeota archaeon]
MRFWKSWIVATKDLSVFKKNKYILYSLIAMPLLMGIVIPAVLIFSLQAESAGIPQAQLVETANMMVNLFTAYFVVIAAVLPTIIASYSFVGEKIERSLEPLLATPTTDGELLFGKSIASFIPCIGATYIGTAIFIAIVDFWSITTMGVLLLPNSYWAIVMGLMTPLACILSVEANVIISSRVSDIRAAQQLGAFVILPLLLVMIFTSSVQFIPLVTLGLIVSAALAVADLGMFYLAKATFKREEILTKWK